VPVYIYGIGRDLFGPKVGRWSALMGMGYPDFLFWSGWLLKDVFIAFLASFVVYQAIRVCQFSELKKAIPLALSLLYLVLLRSYTGFIFSVAILLYFLIAGSRPMKGFSLAMLCVGGAVLIGLILDLPMPSKLSSTIEAYKGIFRRGGGWASSSSDVPATLLGKLWLFSRAFWWMLVNPTWISPPEGYSPYRWLLYPGAAIWYGLIPLSMYGVYYALKQRIKESVLMLFPIFSLMLVYALAFGGGGAGERLQVMSFLLIFAAVGLVKAVERFNQRS